MFQQDGGIGRSGRGRSGEGAAASLALDKGTFRALSGVAAGRPADGGQDNHPWDRAQIMRRARRIADLSQREIAARIGVGPATIARAESGAGVSLAVVEAVLEQAGLRILVVDRNRVPIEPMRPDAARNHGGRHYPAHLDARIPTATDEPYEGWRQDRPPPRLIFHHRYWREQRRKRIGVIPRDHSSEIELRLARHLRRRRRPAWLDEFQRLRPPPAPCECGPACETYCVPDCRCQCEPVGCDVWEIGELDLPTDE